MFSRISVLGGLDAAAEVSPSRVLPEFDPLLDGLLELQGPVPPGLLEALEGVRPFLVSSGRRSGKRSAPIGQALGKELFFGLIPQSPSPLSSSCLKADLPLESRRVSVPGIRVLDGGGQAVLEVLDVDGGLGLDVVDHLLGQGLGGEVIVAYSAGSRVVPQVGRCGRLCCSIWKGPVHLLLGWRSQKETSLPVPDLLAQLLLLLQPPGRWLRVCSPGPDSSCRQPSRISSMASRAA
jgi:hypothetical protein